MENTVPVHVLDGFEQLVHVVLYPGLWHIVLATLDCLIQVHVHDFKNEGQSASRFVKKDLNELDNVAVWR